MKIVQIKTELGQKDELLEDPRPRQRVFAANHLGADPDVGTKAEKGRERERVPMRKAVPTRGHFVEGRRVLWASKVEVNKFRDSDINKEAGN